MKETAVQTKTPEAAPQKISAPSRPGVSSLFSTHPLLQLQRTVGNQALQHFIQAKLEIGRPGDRFEQEADRIADEVVSSLQDSAPHPFHGLDGEPNSSGHCLTRDIQSGFVQRASECSKGESASSDSVAEVLSSSGQPLDRKTRTCMEGRFRRDFGGVRIHAGPEAAESARAIQARAYTLGPDLVFASGAYNPDTTAGLRLLAHELTHVVQQASGRVRNRVQRDTADERISRHTSWGNLHEDALGQELARLLPAGVSEVKTVVGTLGGTDQDDVAFYIVQKSSDEALRGAGNGFLGYLRDKLKGGWTSDDEYQVIGRLDQLMGGIAGVPQSPTAPADLSGTPSEVIDRFTSWLNLDQSRLGRALAARAVADPDLLLRMLNALSSTDRDDVAEAIVNNLSDTDLAASRDDLLQRLQAELYGRVFSWTSDSEYQAIGRLDAAIRTRSLIQPIVGEASEKSRRIEDFIQLIEEEEAKAPPEEQTNTKLMITRCRKLFYGTEGWDKHLIPGAAGVKPLYRVQEVEKTRRTIEVPYLPNMMTYVEKEPRLQGAPGQLTEPRKIQEVRLPDGTIIDLGHVFAGLDALNFPAEVDGPGTVNISKNVDAVTWLGDLGSVLAEAVLKAVESDRVITASEYQAIINEYASPQDMLGNIDSYVIGNAFDIRSEKGLKVSQMLRQYYLGEHAARARRFSKFAELVGLGTCSSGSFSNEDAWIESYIDEVNDAAALYLGAQTEAPWYGTLLQRWPGAVGLAMNQGARFLLELLVIALKRLVQGEGR